MFQSSTPYFKGDLTNYLIFLEKDFGVVAPSIAIIWSNKEVACNYIRECPLPAYTNDERIVFTPSLEIWKKLYLKQLEIYAPQEDKDCKILEQIKQFYDQNLSQIDLKQIFYHELAHHSDWFVDVLDEKLHDSFWFEEGMVEYISRYYLYSPENYQKNRKINQMILNLYKKYFPLPSLEEFGDDSYLQEFGHIFATYWHAYLTCDALVERFGSFKAVMESYQSWTQQTKVKTLSEWFDVL